MNMTKKFVHDRKDHTDKNKPLEHDQKCTTTTNNKKNLYKQLIFLPHLDLFFLLFSVFRFYEKSKNIFQPAFAMRSTQTLVEIYNIQKR